MCLIHLPGVMVPTGKSLEKHLQLVGEDPTKYNYSTCGLVVK